MAGFINACIALKEVVLSMEAQIEDQTQVPVFLIKTFIKRTISRKIKLFRRFP